MSVWPPLGGSNWWLDVVKTDVKRPSRHQVEVDLGRRERLDHMTSSKSRGKVPAARENSKASSTNQDPATPAPAPAKIEQLLLSSLPPILPLPSHQICSPSTSLSSFSILPCPFSSYFFVAFLYPQSFSPVRRPSRGSCILGSHSFERSCLLIHIHVFDSHVGSCTNRLSH
jgi:hypothetical protein